MDFFQHQDDARKKTSVLIGYYAAAVVCIILGIYLATAAIFIGVESKMEGTVDYSRLWSPDLFIYVAGGALLIILLGTLYKVAQLGGGGKAVAEMLGGRLLNHGTKDFDEMKILNVVEEMAIASGTPVPPVYMMDGEEGINAFAAGFSPSDAVIGVTRGCVQQLSRDELQGVIAHEFSHILNGDMKLNIKLMGVLHGILVIAMVGYWTLRLSAGGRRHSSGKKDGNAPFIIMGIALLVIGYIGVFFGKLIKSAISRQREYLADASAVQFTRNPDGIAGALKKIGGFSGGSRLATANAEEASHMFFSNGLKSSFTNMLATHPPLTDRIKRIDRTFSGEFEASASSSGSSSAAMSSFAGGGGTPVAVKADDVVSTIGAPSPQHVEYAAQLLSSIPEKVTTAAREPFGARAVIYSLLLNKETEPRTLQLKRLSEHADEAVMSETMRIISDIESLSHENRLPLIDIALGSLRQLSAAQYKSFMENVQHLIEADNQIDLFEFTLQRMIKRHLAPSFKKVTPPAVLYKDIISLTAESITVLSCLAYWGAEKAEDAATAFAEGRKKLALECEIGDSDSCGLTVFAEALDKFNSASHGVRKQLLDACISCVAADSKVTIEEAELLRITSDSIDCPMPPILPGQDI